MNKIFIILNFLLIASLTAISNPRDLKKHKVITISGFISDSEIASFDGILEIFYHEKFNDRKWFTGKIIPVKIGNNRFSITIQPESEICYIEIRKGIERKQILKSLQLDALLFNPGDSVSMDIAKQQSVIFSGRGAEKLNYQLYAGSLAFDWGLMKQINKSTTETIDYWRDLGGTHLKDAKSELERIKSKLSRFTYEVLLTNTMAAINQQHLDHLMAGIFKIKRDSAYLAVVKNDMKSIDITQRSNTLLDPRIIEYSSNYISYLSNFQIKYIALFSGTERPAFDGIFNKIVTEYNGKIRDEMLAYTIDKCYSSLGASKFMEKALNIMNDEHSRGNLKLNDNKARGAKTSDYSFQDLAGNEVHLSEFKGKVVIIDAYFNGCYACIGFAERMAPILNFYKNNKNIVFISLSVDRKIENFRAGAKSGKYGSDNSVYLYTKGQGITHPICLRYGWVMFPSILYLDKMGNVIEAAKIDPINENKKQELISIIESHI